MLLILFHDIFMLFYFQQNINYNRFSHFLSGHSQHYFEQFERLQDFYRICGFKLLKESVSNSHHFLNAEINPQFASKFQIPLR